MGLIFNRGGLQTRVHSETPSIWDEGNNSAQKEFRYFKCRSGRIIKKRCYRKSTSKREGMRFLQHLLSSSQEERKNETSNKFETPKQVSEERTFQNGHIEKSHKPGETKRLGYFSGSERCISTHTNISETQEISPFLHSRTMLAMEMPMLRSFDRASGIFQGYFSDCSAFKGSEYQTSVLSRRLVGSESTKKTVGARSREMPESSGSTGLYNKQREIRTDSQTRDCLHRGCFPLKARNSNSNSREIKKVRFSNTKVTLGPKSSKRFSSSTRPNGFMSGINSQWPTFHETHTITSVSFLASSINGPSSCGSHYATSKIASSVVVRSSQHHEGSLFATGSYTDNHSHGCIKTRLWGPCGQRFYSGNMVQIPVRTSYQSPGVGSSISNCKTFSTCPKEQKCPDKERQHNRLSICESTGRHKVATSVLQNLGFVEFCTRKQHASKSSAHIGSSEHLGRPIKSRESTTYRMANAQSSSTNTVSDLGDTPDRPICIQGEQTDSSLLFLDSTPRCIGNRCSVNLLGRNVCLCIPSNMSHTQSTATYGAVSLSDYSHCTKMASQALVPRPSKIPDSMSKKTTSVARPVTTAQNNDQSSKSRSIQSACLATIDRSFQEKGFSNQSRKLISASWRSGTQRDYTGKFNKFCSWCSTRQIDPYSASLVQVADFLTDLFNNGLQYRTIAGYRSMLSAVLQPINNTPVGQHPYIIRLLKGVFNSRPPKVKILLEWDLQLVLNMLQKQPFEPLSKASLKHITFKLIFLMAISTFRRCSDLQSLKIGKGSVCVQKKGITFIRHGLAKQDRESHFGSKIFVPAFEENYRLDPKRALYWYLKKTQLLRVSSDGTVERKIFLALNKPHQAVSTQTISNWIVQTTVYSRV